MKKREEKNSQQVRAVRMDEVLPWAELGRRMGWGAETLAAVGRAGLRFAVVGRMKVTRGDWVASFIEQQARRQAGTVNGGQCDE